LFYYHAVILNYQRHRKVVAPKSSFSTILKESALLPDVYDPTVNPLFRDVHARYGVMAMPCRIQDPARKAYVSLQEFPLGIEALEHDLSAKTRFARSTNASSDRSVGCNESEAPSIPACRHNPLRIFRSTARNWYGQLDDK
jgi:hypothetical protein